MLGIPVTLKDNIETAAPMHTTGGAEILLKNQPKADASFVKQLRDAGAVILGKANLSELAGGIMLMPAGVERGRRAGAQSARQLLSGGFQRGQRRGHGGV